MCENCMSPVVHSSIATVRLQSAIERVAQKKSPKPTFGQEDKADVASLFKVPLMPVGLMFPIRSFLLGSQHFIPF